MNTHLYKLTMYSTGGYCLAKDCKVPANTRKWYPTWILGSFELVTSSGESIKCEDKVPDMEYFCNVGELGYYWPSLDAKVSGQQLWMQLFRKYGSCIVKPDCPPEKYHQTAIDLFKALNISSILDDQNVRPYNNDTMDAKDVYRAVLAGTRLPYVDCKPVSGETPVVYSISLFYNVSSMEFSKAPGIDEGCVGMELSRYVTSDAVRTA